MSKKNSVQQKHRQQRKERLAAERAAQKEKNVKKGFIIGISAAVAIALIVTGIIAGVAAYRSSNAYKTSIVPITSDNYSVDLAMLAYYYYDGVYGLIDMYGEELEKEGICPDPTKSLEDQYNAQTSWHDFFMESAQSQITQNLVLAEAARAENIVITDGEKEALLEKSKRIDLSRYGKGVTSEDVYRCLELDYIAIKYEFTKRSADEMHGEELEEYYDEFYKHFSTVDFRCLEVPYGDSISASDAEGYANAVIQTPTEAGFTSAVRENCVYINPSLTLENIEQIVQASYVNDSKYSEGDIVSEWLFDDARKPYDTFVYHNEVAKSYTAYMITAIPEKDMNDTVTVRHILFRPETYGSEQAANEKAQQVMASLQAEGVTAENIAKYAISYSEDAATCYLGGMYENVTAEELEAYLSEFKAWGFDDSRKNGDCEIITTGFGSHIIYFEGEGLPSALGRTQAQVSSEKFGEMYTGLTEKYKINTDTNKLFKFKG